MPRCCFLTTHLLAAGVRPLFSRIHEMRPYHMPVWGLSSWCFFASLLCRLRSACACIRNISYRLKLLSAAQLPRCTVIAIYHR